ncbi:hypothetical protein II582_03060 [bacterium]|nr:hypothetical protein [bacterium]
MGDIGLKSSVPDKSGPPPLSKGGQITLIFNYINASCTFSREFWDA